MDQTQHMVISDCWGAYNSLAEQGYTHLTVNHSMGFVDHDISVHTNTIESCWLHLKVFINPYNRKMDYVYDVGQYMFAVKCNTENVNQFTKFLHLIAMTDWSLLPSESASGSTREKFLPWHLKTQVQAHAQ
jgi:hypothetical protein